MEAGSESSYYSGLDSSDAHELTHWGPSKTHLNSHKVHGRSDLQKSVASMNEFSNDVTLVVSTDEYRALHTVGLASSHR